MVIRLFHLNSSAEMGQRLPERGVGVRVLNVPWFHDPGVDVVSFASVDMESSMMRVNSLSTVLTVAADELETAGFLPWLVH